MTWTRVSAPTSTPNFSNYIRGSNKGYFLLSSPRPSDDNTKVPQEWLSPSQDTSTTPTLSVQVTRGALGRTVHFSLCFNLFSLLSVMWKQCFSHVYPAVLCWVGAGMCSCTTHLRVMCVPRCYLCPEQALWGSDDENVKGRTEDSKVQKYHSPWGTGKSQAF